MSNRLSTWVSGLGSGNPATDWVVHGVQGGQSRKFSLGPSAIGDAVGTTVGTPSAPLDSALAQAVARGMVALGLALPAATWTDSAIAYTGVGVNVTDTASAAGSKLLDLQVGGVSKLNVGKDGSLNLTGAAPSSGAALTLGSGLAIRAAGTVYYDTLAGSNGDLVFRPNSVERMRITAAGNVGIGTAAPNYNLDVVGRQRWAQVASSSVPIGLYTDSVGANNSYLALYNASDAWLFAVSKNGTGAVKPIRFATNDFGNSTSGIALAIEPNGNVGIGTGTPAVALHVVGATRVATGTDNLASGITGGAAYLQAFNNASGTTPIDLAFLSGTAERMRITSGGSVGIGTASPAAKLHAYRNDGNPSYLTLENGGNFGVYHRFKRPNQEYVLALDINNNGGTDFSLYNATAGTFPLTVLANSTVRIGSTSSFGHLTVKGAAGTAAAAFLSNGLGYDDISSLRISHGQPIGAGVGYESPFLGVNIQPVTAATTNLPRAAATVGGFDAAAAIAFDQTSGNINFFTGDGLAANASLGHRVTITGAAGYVGIGTNNPQYHLDVLGYGRFGQDDSGGARPLLVGNYSAAASTAKWAGVSFRGMDTGGAAKEVALIGAFPRDQDWVNGHVNIYSRFNDALRVSLQVAFGGALVIPNCAIQPDTPNSAIALFVEGGVLKFKDTAGNIRTISYT